VIGLFPEHLAGADVGMQWSGVIPKCRQEHHRTLFGGHGDGIGGTTLRTPRDSHQERGHAHAGGSRGLLPSKVSACTAGLSGQC
jgi:hypothetical protein